MPPSHNLIYVLGVPSGGTSAVAGVLRCLGVDFGPLAASKRPYPVFEDPRVARNYSMPAPEGHIAAEIAPGRSDPLRNFRAYCEMRLSQALGRIGVKIGANVWLGDPDPASLPVDIVRVTRPLEDSIRSNLRYGGETGQDAIRRAMQIGGYWQACEDLSRVRPPVATVSYYDLLRDPSGAILGLAAALELKPSREQECSAREFVDASMRHV